MLEAFGFRKSSLLDALSLISELAESAGRDDARQAAQEISTQLNQGQFNLVVLGEFKRGKSTLINAMLGKQVVPSAVTPLTSVATEIRYSTRDHAIVHFLNGDKRCISLEEIEEYATEKRNPRNEKHVSKVEAFVESPFLSGGLVLVDTPGVGSTYMHNTKSAYEYIPKADAAILVVSADPPISRAECDFLRDVRRFVNRIFFVQNKVDHLSEDDMVESVEFTHDVIASEVGSSGIKIYPISAKMALSARLSSDKAMLHKSLLPVFEADLSMFLTKGKGKVLLESVTRKTAGILSDLELAISLEMKAITTPYDQLAAKAQEFSELVETIEREQSEAEWILNGEVEKTSEIVTQEIYTFKEEAIEKIVRDMERYLSQSANIPIRGLPDSLTKFVKERILDEFTAFREAQVSLAEERFGQIVDCLGSKVAPRIADVKASAARLFGIEVEVRSEPILFQQETDFYFLLDEIPTLSPFRPGTLQSLLPKGVARDMIRKATKEKVRLLVDRQCGRIRYDIVSRLNNSAMNLKEDLRRRFSEVLSLTEGLYRKALVQKEAGEAQVSERLSRLEALSANLEEIKRAVTSTRPQPPKTSGENLTNGYLP
ncbi:MAG: dynamin family protein [Ignavibacteriales bacterium]